MTQNTLKHGSDHIKQQLFEQTLEETLWIDGASYNESAIRNYIAH